MGISTLTISSKNYSSWSLRGWLLCKFVGLEFDEKRVPTDDASARAELLLLSPSFLVPCLEHDGNRIWDTIAIGWYLNDLYPEAGLLPRERRAAAHCRSICGEMHSGFASLRSALPMNLKAHHPGFDVWPAARADIDRISNIWNDCLAAYGGPYLFGSRTMADAMYAPVVTRFQTYDVTLNDACAAYCRTMLQLPAMREWFDGAAEEPDEIDELDAEF